MFEILKDSIEIFLVIILGIIGLIGLYFSFIAIYRHCSLMRANKKVFSNKIAAFIGAIYILLCIWGVAFFFVEIKNTILATAIQPSLDIATSITILLTILIYILTSYRETQKRTEMQSAEMKKREELQLRDATKQVLKHIREQIDNIQKEMIDSSVKLSQQAQKLQKQNRFMSKQQIEECYEYPFSLLSRMPQEIRIEFQQAIVFMPERYRGLTMMKLNCELKVLEHNIEAMTNQIEKLIDGYEKAVRNQNQKMKEFLGGVITFFSSRENSSEAQGLYLPLAVLDKTYFAMQKYMMHVIAYNDHYQENYADMLLQVKEKALSYIKELKIVKLILEQEKIIDYDLVLLQGVIAEDKNLIKYALKCGADMEMIIQDVPSLAQRNPADYFEEMLTVNIDYSQIEETRKKDVESYIKTRTQKLLLTDEMLYLKYQLILKKRSIS